MFLDVTSWLVKQTLIDVDLIVTKSDVVDCDPNSYEVKCFLMLTLWLHALVLLDGDLVAIKADVNRC